MRHITSLVRGFRLTFKSLLEAFLWIGGLFVSIGMLQAQVTTGQADYSPSDGRRVVVVLSLDGFRSDYLHHARTPHIDSMMSVGTSGSLKPCFPSLTFPNHYSIATGLHPDHHGLVSNRFCDSTLGVYRIGDRRAVEDARFYGGEPIWNTAQRQGLRSAVYFWVGSEAPIGGHHPDRWFRYDGSTTYTYTARADSVMSWLSLPESERPNIIMWYIDEPDHAGHTFGTESADTYAAVERMDSLVGYFLNKLREHPLKDSVDFLLVSDHGMATYTAERSVDLTTYLDYKDFDYIVDGVPTLLYPKAGCEQQVMDRLSAVPCIKAYRRAELPERLHYGSNARVGGIVVIPDVGTYLYFRPDVQMNDGGAHGYDNNYPEMRAIFVAMGGSFDAGRRISPPIPNITLYPLMCYLLGITPASHDADEEVARSLIKTTR